MNGQSVFSGLGQDGYAAVLGEAAWPHVATRWKAPATVLDSVAP